MTIWWLSYLGVGVTAVAVTALVVPLCRRLSWRLDILDKPLGQSHKKHAKATPLLGGLAMLLGWVITVLGGLSIGWLAPGAVPAEVAEVMPGINDVKSLLGVMVLGAVSMTLMGLVDDKKALGPAVKFFLQFLICGVVSISPRVSVTLFWDNFWVSWVITVCWYLFIINSFNFLDNMDGLASGLAAIAATLFSVVAGFRGQHFVAALGMATAGAAVGFYLYNRSPASIFMGDSGSHLLGFLLATLGTLTLFYKEGETPTIAALAIPVLILALPIFDTFAVVLIRLREGRPIYTGDHSHISHRFLKLGLDRKTAVICVHLLALTLGLSGITLLWVGLEGVILVSVQAVAILALVSILHGVNGSQKTPPSPSPAPAKEES